MLGNQKRPANQGLVSCPRNLFALIVQQTWRNILWQSVVKHLPKAKRSGIFFSSVAALERRSKGKNKNNEEQEDEQNDEVQEKYCPAIT